MIIAKLDAELERREKRRNAAGKAREEKQRRKEQKKREDETCEQNENKKRSRKGREGDESKTAQGGTRRIFQHLFQFWQPFQARFGSCLHLSTDN